MLIISSILITKMYWNVEKFRNFEYFQTDSNFSKQKLGNVLQTAVTLTLFCRIYTTAFSSCFVQFGSYSGSELANHFEMLAMLNSSLFK